jgi:hypothetical protein
MLNIPVTCYVLFLAVYLGKATAGNLFFWGSTDEIKRIRHLGFVLLKSDILDFFRSIQLGAGSSAGRSQLLSRGMLSGKERRERSLSTERMLDDRVSPFWNRKPNKSLLFYFTHGIRLVSPQLMIPYVTNDGIEEQTQR